MTPARSRDREAGYPAGAGPCLRRGDRRCPGARAWRRDQGSASVWVLAAGLLLLAAALVGAALGAAHVARHRAQSAADLGALAGAARSVEGPAVACARAAELVAANGGRLMGCRLDGLDVTLTVEVTVPPAVGRGRTATATARAGPVRADDSR